MTQCLQLIFAILQIFRPMCDQSQSEKTYCHSQRKCVTSGCGNPSNRLGDIEFYPPASKPVFCPDVERFKPDDNNTCPQPPTLTVPQADYMLMYEFAANVTQKGEPFYKRLYITQGTIAYCISYPEKESTACPEKEPTSSPEEESIPSP